MIGSSKKKKNGDCVLSTVKHSKNNSLFLNWCPFYEVQMGVEIFVEFYASTRLLLNS